MRLEYPEESAELRYVSAMEQTAQGGFGRDGIEHSGLMAQRGLYLPHCANLRPKKQTPWHSNVCVYDGKDYFRPDRSGH